MIPFVAYLESESNFELELEHLQSEFINIKYSILPTLVIMASDSIGLIRQRLQNRGENKEGVKLLSKSSAKIGAYSSRYSMYRTNVHKLQTEHIDLTLTGDLMNSIKQQPPIFITNGISIDVTIGATDGHLQGLKDNFGEELFELSSEEKNIINSSFNEKFKISI